MERIILVVAVALIGAQPALGQTKPDSMFHAMQMRGRIVMGVDQYTSSHKFESLPDGGRIELQRDVEDARGASVIRQHLAAIAKAFAKGDFTAPAVVHMKDVAGAAEMTARKTLIRYHYKELKRGGEIRIETRDPEAVRAIHAFLAFQRSEHHAH
ncbi:MAG: hypothetical protein WEE89_12325 [Gemmatimonadota bacterium]